METYKTELQGVPLEWNFSKGTFSFFGIDSCLFWISPSLKKMIEPLAKELGPDLFKMLVAHSSSFGTEEDYHAMVTFFSDNFYDGFLEWGKAVGLSGWGKFEINKYNFENKKATVTVYNCWELKIHQELGSEGWGCPFIQGKIIGIFSKGLDTNVWADEVSINIEDPENKSVTFDIYESDRTIEKEIEIIRRQHAKERERELLEKVAHKTTELEATKEELYKYSLNLENKVKERTHELDLIIQKLNTSNFELTETKQELLKQNQELRSATEQLISIQKTLNDNQEKLKVAKEKAEESSATKSRFLSNMSHEIRTPLNAIIGFSELMLEGKMNRDDQQKSLSSIHYSANHLYSIIKGILDVAKFDDQNIKVTTSDFKILQALEELKRNVSHSTQKKGLDFHLELDSAVPSVIKGDQVKINQILYNLTGNAVKFTKKGFVKVSVSIETLISDQQKYICFEIIDTGFGIDKKEYEQIFQKFVRLENTEGVGGTGLGLYITKNLIDLMGGKIDIKSELGKGSTFLVYLPFVPTHSPTLAISKQEPVIKPIDQLTSTVKKDLTILCVEDNEMNQMLNQQLLSSITQKLILVSNSYEGLEQLENHNIDVLITDIEMEGMSGDEFIKKIRLHNKALPIIVITANASEELQKNLSSYNLLGIVTKPIKKQRLFELLEHV